MTDDIDKQRKVIPKEGEYRILGLPYGLPEDYHVQKYINGEWIGVGRLKDDPEMLETCRKEISRLKHSVVN